MSLLSTSSKNSKGLDTSEHFELNPNTLLKNQGNTQDLINNEKKNKELGDMYTHRPNERDVLDLDKEQAHGNKHEQKNKINCYSI